MDRSTRVSLLQSLDQYSLGTFDEACTEFIRVPARSEHPAATVRGLTADYRADELGRVPLAAQLMGSSPELLAAAAVHLVNVKGAPRIDLNCGELTHALSWGLWGCVLSTAWTPAEPLLVWQQRIISRLHKHGPTCTHHWALLPPCPSLLQAAQPTW